MVSPNLHQTYPQHHKEAGKCHLHVLQVESGGKEQLAPTWGEICNLENQTQLSSLPRLLP